jgi:hypothetical protein
MNLDSREYQCQLRAERFADAGSATAALLDFVAGLNRDVRLSTKDLRRTQFAQTLYDTRSGAFKAGGLVLRRRRFPDGDACTFKASARDRYDVEAAPIESSDRDAEAKLEENIYAFHSLFTRQVSVRLKRPRDFSSVAAWDAIFERASRIAPGHEPLIAVSTTFFLRSTGLVLDFGGQATAATLELKYADTARTRLSGAELSWRHREGDEDEFKRKPVRLMRQFFAAVNRSPWVDLAIDLARCQDATGPP